jgi:hypothetical protein
MITVRKSYPAFGHGRFIWAETGNSSIAAYWRVYENERILVINNLLGEAQTVQVSLPAPSGSLWLSEHPQDLLGAGPYPFVQGQDLLLGMEPYQYRWFMF